MTISVPRRHGSLVRCGVQDGGVHFDEVLFLNTGAEGGGVGVGGWEGGGGEVMSRCHCSWGKPDAIFQILSAANPDPFMFL